MRRCNLKLFVLLAATTAVIMATIGTAAGADLSIQATVGQSCEITTTPLDFGDYNPLDGTNDKTANGIINAKCTPGDIPTINLGPGNNLNSQRHLLKTTTGGETLEYYIYKPTGAGQTCTYTGTPDNWGPGVSGTGYTVPSAPGTGGVNYYACGLITKSQSVPQGTYTDSVAVTVTF